MFVALKPLLAQCQSVTLILTAAGPNMTVTVMPKPIDAKISGALSQPMQLTGTAEELDAGLSDAISSFSGKRLSLVEQVEATNAILDAARKESAEKSHKSPSKSSASTAKKGVQSAGNVSAGDEEHEEDEENPSNNASEPKVDTDAAAASSGQPVSAANLFE